MRILVVNDDGIDSAGIEKLARISSKLGEVWVVAPASQCSAMSQKITIRGSMLVKEKTDFPVKGVRAFSVDGTPADCVRIGIECILPKKPDIVFSGINIGYNCGHDILYSGTVGAALEALVAKIPAIAFSSDVNGTYDVVDEYLLPITKELIDNRLEANEIWNVNFPGCSADNLEGIIWDAKPAHMEIFTSYYDKKINEDGSFYASLCGDIRDHAPEKTDIYYVLNNYISIGKIKNFVI